MNDRYLVAKNANQLDICLRFLYSECVEYDVVLREGEGGELYYAIHIVSLDASKLTIEEVEKRYNNLV